MATKRSISALPFKGEFTSYGWPHFRSDALASVAVALLAIPQSIAYSLLAGLPPMAGLFAAIFGTLFAAAFGSSRHLISGPSTGTALLIQTAIADVLYNNFEAVTGPARDALALHLLGQLVLLMAVIQIGAAFFNVSKLLQFVSRPVILAYFAGIAVAIVVNQLYPFFGIDREPKDLSTLLKAGDFVVHVREINGMSAVIGGGSFALLLLLKRKFPTLPYALIMLIAGAIATEQLNRWVGEGTVKQLNVFPLTEMPVPDFSFSLLDLKLLNKIFPAAVALSFLAILEAFSVSRAFAAQSGQKVQVNQDVFGLGVANYVLSFLSGSMPASGSATRTALSYRLGSNTRLAAILSAVWTALFLFFLWPWVQRIALPSLAALLIATVPALVNWQEIRLSFRATREDAWVFLLTFFSCLIFSLDIAFFVGIVISIGSYLKKSSTPILVEYAFNPKGRLMVVSPKEEAHRKIRIIGIGGDLYFAAADVFQNAMESVAEDKDVEAIVLRLNNVHHMDASMCLAIARLHEQLALSRRHLVISGLTEEVWHVFHRAGIVKTIGLDNLYFTDESNPQFSTWKACLRAQELIHKKRPPPAT
jgi:SulP family sulfate permease